MQRASSLPSLAAPSEWEAGAARTPAASPATLTVDSVRNATRDDRAPLNFAGATLSPWQGAGSQKAMIASQGADRWRVKATADGASSAMEVTLGKLFQLTGLLAPDTALVGALDGLPTANLHVGSRYEPQFQDLGDFLVSDAAADLVAADNASSRPAYDTLRATHAASVAANTALLRDAGVEWWALGEVDARAHAANDRARFDALDAMNRMLRAPLRCEQMRHFIASRWLDNWDHLNYRMENFGYTLRDGERVGMSLDFGSCGPLGFRDPQTGVMLPKQLSGEVAIRQRPASLFPIPEAFAANASGFDAMQADPGALHDTTCWPYGFQSESIAALFRPPAASDPAIADALVEMGYRLAVLPASSIEAVIERHWPNLAPTAAQAWPQAAALTGQMIARRDALLARFDPAQIRDWLHADPVRAARVRQEVTDAMQRVLGADAVAPHQQHVERLHEALLGSGEPIASTTDDICINGVCRETRAMQQFDDALQQLEQAWASESPQGMADAVAALLAPPLHTQLLHHLALGPGRHAHTLAAFDTNHAWLVLMEKLVAMGQANPSEVARLLLTPVEAGSYPPDVAAWSEKHPELGIAFIQLLEGLVARGVPAQRLRVGLLTAKRSGTANYFAELLGSRASAAWIERLKLAQLWPGAEDLREAKSWRSRTAFGLRSLLPRGQVALAAPRAAHALQQMAPGPLVAQLRRENGPARLLVLETELLRQEVLESVRLVHRDEVQALSTSVAQAVWSAWAEALQKHGLPHASPPRDLLESQQHAARSRFEQDMWALRREDAEALIAEATTGYGEAVRAQPTLTAEARKALFRGGVDRAIGAIGAMVADAAGTSPPPAGGATLGAEVAARAQSVAQGVQLQVQQRAQAQAGQSASRWAAAEAGRRATDAVAARAQSSALAHSQRAAALLAYETATNKARQAAQSRATQEAAERAARVSAARTESATSEVALRLALLRLPAPPSSPPGAARRTADAARIRTAQYLDTHGRPRTGNR
ncbi:hypothetical protein [Stenotrophomonas sp. PD6]|uniref:hypothetical protein n=1 Tax=Stenotrophomonas sp. PD6 TaxID=3368612 RepID=UPI003BA0537A